MEHKKVKKANKIFILFLAVIFSLFFGFSAFAYEIPQDSYRMTVSCSAGDAVIAIPYNLARYISIEENELISQYSSTVTLYGNTISTNSRPFNVRLQPFSSAEWRYTDQNYTYSDFDIYDVISSNVPFLQDTDFTIFSHDTLVNMSVLMILCSIIVLMLKKR